MRPTTTPMTTPDAKRSFSTLKRIIRFLRNSITQDCLTALSMSEIDKFNEKTITKINRHWCYLPLCKLLSSTKASKYWFKSLYLSLIIERQFTYWISINMFVKYGKYLAENSKVLYKKSPLKKLSITST